MRADPSNWGVRGRMLVAMMAVGLVLAPGMPGGVATPGPAACFGGTGHVWFLGVVYDAAQANFFKVDLDTFERWLATLRASHCIPDSQAKVLAFDNDFQRNGKTYEEASEANIKRHLAEFGAAASAHPDSVFFFFLSTHGIAWPTPCNNALRPIGSLAGVKAGGGEDGDLEDCELGAALRAFGASTRMFLLIDCSLCGGFSDSLTAVSGTVPDNSLPASSGVPARNRVVVTGCAITTECFGRNNTGTVSFIHFNSTLAVPACDGWTAPLFPTLQGINAPVRSGARDGRCSASEWFYAAVDASYDALDPVAVQQQFRMKYGFAFGQPDLPIV